MHTATNMWPKRASTAVSVMAAVDSHAWTDHPPATRRCLMQGHRRGVVEEHPNVQTHSKPSCDVIVVRVERAKAV